MDALGVRHQAALELVATGAIDGLLALSLVIAPGPELERWSQECARPDARQRWTDQHRAQAATLRAQGLPYAEIAERVCGARRFSPTVKTRFRPTTQARQGPNPKS